TFTLALLRRSLCCGGSGRCTARSGAPRGLPATLGIVGRLGFELLAGHREEQSVSVARYAQPLVRNADFFLADTEHSADGNDGLDDVVCARDDQILHLAQALAALVLDPRADQLARLERPAA